MSDEHNKPENSSVAKPRSPRRPAAKKSPAESTGVETASTASAENSPATSDTPKAAKPRAPRRKSPAATTADNPAATTGEVSKEADKAPAAPKKLARKRAPRKITSENAAPSVLESATQDAPAAEAKPSRSHTAQNARATKPADAPAASASQPAPEASTNISTAAPKASTGEPAPAAAKQDKPTAPRARSRRGTRTNVAATAKAMDEAAEAPAASPTRKAEPAETTQKPEKPTTKQPQALAPVQPTGDALPDTTAREHTVAPAHVHISSSEGGDEGRGESEGENAAREDGEQAPQRKSRRGRRGGRGRNRKARQGVQDTDQNTTEAPSVPLDESGDAHVKSVDLDADFQDEDDEAMDSPPAAESSARGRNKKESPKKATRGKEKEVESDSKPGRRKMFISVVPGEQVEVALVEEGVIGEYYLDMLHQAKTKGNIYKGVVHNVDPNLQAAFVNYGPNKNGFLQIDEIHSEYYLAHHEAAKGKKYPPIQKVIKPGQEVLVQVVKEPTGNKGAFLTTWLSLAGRFLVLTPGQEQIGVSRKVDNDEERARLREMMNGIEPGEGLGVIVRTVSAGTSKTTLKNDLQYLKRVWKEIRRRGTAESAPSLVYQESSLAERAVRDYLTEDVCEVWVDNESVAESLRETVALLFPRKEDLVRVHADVRQTLWERFNIQRQLEQIYSREVTLPSGGRLVFDQTEALMAIDINSGKISGKANFESMALKTNIEAAEAIARHLKLRDIGGQVVIDFIEMRDKSHVREVEKTLRNAMKNDRARHDVARMSSFGLLEIVRQRTGSSALAVTMEPCPCCNGTGIRRNLEWQSLQALRQIGRQARTPGTTRCIFEANAELGMYLLNHKRDRLREMEQQLNVPIEIRIQP